MKCKVPKKYLSCSGCTLNCVKVKICKFIHVRSALECWKIPGKFPDNCRKIPGKFPESSGCTLLVFCLGEKGEKGENGEDSVNVTTILESLNIGTYIG